MGLVWLPRVLGSNDKFHIEIGRGGSLLGLWVITLEDGWSCGNIERFMK